MNLTTLKFLVLPGILVLGSRTPALATGSIHGNIGSETYIYVNALGNDQGNGAATSLNVTGEYGISNLPGDRYYVISAGLQKFYLPDGADLEINDVPGYPPAYSYTYGPYFHRSHRLGQTFVANGEFLHDISTTNAGDDAQILCRVYEDGPGGNLVWDGGYKGSGHSNWWAVWVVTPPGSVRLVPGRRYYVELSSESYIMIPYHQTNPYLDGQTYVLRESTGDMLPIPYSDLTMTIGCQPPGESQEYYSHGAENGSWVGSVYQSYTAKGTSLRSVHFFLPWDSNQPYTRENYMFTLHHYGGRSNPVGAQIGPAKRGTAGVSYPNGCGATWDSGECPTVPGQQYLIRVTKTDGGFVAYHRTTDTSGVGDFFKDGVFVPNGSLNGNIYADAEDRLPLAISDVHLTSVGATSAQIVWTTDVPAMTQVEYWTGANDHQHTHLDETLTTSHAVQLTRLKGSTTYYFRAKSYRLGHDYAISDQGQFTTSPAGMFFGTVYDNTGQPVIGATIQTSPGPFGSYSTVTEIGGSFLIENVEPGIYTVSASRDGLLPATVYGKEAIAGQPTNCDIVMQVIGEYVSNGGFETHDLTGWPLVTYSTSGGYTPEPPGVHCMPVPFYAEITPKSGDCFLNKATNWWGHNGFVGQQISVTQGLAYRLTAYYRLYWVSGVANDLRCMLAIDPQGRFSTTGYTYADVVRSPLLTWPTPGVASPWLSVSVECTALSDHVTAWLLYWQNVGEWRINCWDDVTISRIVASLSAAKAESDGLRVAVHGAVVTATQAQLGDRLYVESPTRETGIQVYLGSDESSVVEGDVVTVEGRLATRDGEKCIENATLTKTGSVSPLRPLAMSPSRAGGGDFAYQTGPPTAGQRGVTGGIGANNIGLLIRCAGAVAASGDSHFLLNDGSLPGGAGLRVEVPPGVDVPAVGTVVGVTGVCGVTLNGVDNNPVLRVRGASDLTIFP